MKHKDVTQAERTLAEKHQLKDVAWAKKQIRRAEEKIPLIRALHLFFSRLRARIAVRSIRNQAHRDGLDHMTGKDIDELIRRARKDR